MRRAGFIALAIVYALIFGEVFVRLMRPAPLLPRYVEAAPYGVRRNVPNAQYPQTTEEVRVEVRINAQGMRADREFPLEKPPGVCRIVAYGDSFFVGYEVDLEDALLTRLEERLREAGIDCEVLNLAVSGFGTAEMLVALEADGLRYDPDVVLFQWHATDPEDNARSGLFRVDTAGGVVRAADAYLPAVGIREALMEFAAYRWLIENSQLYAALRERAAALTKDLLTGLRRLRAGLAAPAEAPAPSAPPPRAPRNDASNLDLALLQAARDRVRAEGGQFAVVDIPTAVSRSFFRSAFEQLPDAAERTLHLVSPLEEFFAVPAEERRFYYEKGHGHLTPLGNEVVADALARDLLRSGWLEAYRGKPIRSSAVAR